MNNLVEGIHLSKYAYSESEKNLRNEIIINPISPFLADGKNLTITFLSLNRVAFSIRLLTSIQTYLPEFKGNILVFDNGSEPNELKQLKDFSATLPFPVKIYEAGKNYGVAGGRNQSAQMIETDWFLALDNDVYFVENPLPGIKDCIEKLGVHFLNLPLLNSDKQSVYRIGGNLFFKEYKDSFAVDCPASFTAGLMSEINLSEPFLSTCLFGTAAVIKTDSFIAQGGFDDQMLIGFEDLDFSIKLYKEGIKIGNLNKFYAVHAHDLPLNSADLDYEKTRYSQQILQQSGEYFYAKHKIYAWTKEVNEWINVREKELSLSDENVDFAKQIELHNQSKAYDSKNNPDSDLPRIALIADVENWAFHNYCKQIVKNLSQFYDFKIFFLADFPEIENLLLEVKDYDLIHFFWREALYSILAQYSRSSITEKGWNYEEFLSNVVAKSNITTSIYDHLFLSQAEVAEREILFNALSIGYTTVSKRLEKIYSGIPNYPKPFGAVEDGVDLEFFQPANLERLTDENKEIVIGWVGNSKWRSDDGIDHKGLETIIKPVVENLRKEGYKISGFYADSQDKLIPHSEMNDYYNSIDIYVCASDIEGTPNPILEAMACGIPVVTTDVGMVPQLFGSLQKQFILPARSLENLKAKLIQLIDNPQKREALSKENLQSIKKWSWENQCQGWNEFFQFALSFPKSSQHRERRDLLRKQILENHFVNAEKRKLEEKVQQLETELQSAQTRVGELENWTLELQGLFEKAENRIHELEDWAADLQTVVSEANEQIKLEIEQNEKAQINLTRKDAEIEELQTKQNQIQNELASALLTIANMEESNFWKLRNNWVKLKDKVSLEPKERQTNEKNGKDQK